MATTGDPYSNAPSAFFGNDAIPVAFDSILSNINYPDVATVYGPVTQWIFAAGYLIAPAGLWPLQLLGGVADLGVLLLLGQFTRNNYLLLYAWSPLLVKEFVVVAHPDILAIFCCVLAWHAWFRQRALLCGVSLGIAVGIKVFAILLAPFLLLRIAKYCYSAKAIAGFIATLAVITLAFGNIGIWYPEGLRAMATGWLFNSPLYTLISGNTDFQTRKIILLGGFCLFSLWMLYQFHWDHGQRSQPSKPTLPTLRGDWLFGAFLITLPVINPWYIAWLLPFAVVTSTGWAWVASLAVLLSYYSGIYTGDTTLELHQLPYWIMLLEYGMIITAMIIPWNKPLTGTR